MTQGLWRTATCRTLPYHRPRRSGPAESPSYFHRSSGLPCLLSAPSRCRDPLEYSPGIIPTVTRQRFTVREAARIPEEHLGRQRGDRPHAGMRHESRRGWPRPSLLDPRVELIDLRGQTLVQRHDAPSAGRPADSRGRARMQPRRLRRISLAARRWFLLRPRRRRHQSSAAPGQPLP